MSRDHTIALHLGNKSETRSQKKKKERKEVETDRVAISDKRVREGSSEEVTGSKDQDEAGNERGPERQQLSLSPTATLSDFCLCLNGQSWVTWPPLHSHWKGKEGFAGGSQDTLCPGSSY